MPRALIFGVYPHLVVFYQVCSIFTPVTKNGLATGAHGLRYNQLFSEYGNVAYQFKDNEAYNNITIALNPLCGI